MKLIPILIAATLLTPQAEATPSQASTTAPCEEMNMELRKAKEESDRRYEQVRREFDEYIIKERIEAFSGEALMVIQRLYEEKAKEDGAQGSGEEGRSQEGS